MPKPRIPAKRERLPSATKKARFTSADIYMTLREMIINFEIYPGSRVTETDLADHFNVSRTPIREALQRLEHENFLIIRPKQGCFIRELDIGELVEHYQVRIALEMAVVERACAVMPTSELELLAAQWDPSEIPSELSAVAMDQLDESFHLALARGSRNMTMVRYLKEISSRISVIRRINFDNRERITRTYREHFEIVQSLLQRDVSKAQALIKRHIIRSEEFAKTLTLTQLARTKAFAKRFDVSG